jgi:HD superfamily phosphohydrolase
MKNKFIGRNGLQVGFVSLERDKPIGKPSEQGEVWLAHATIPNSSNSAPKFVVKISKEPIEDEGDVHYKLFVEEFNVLSTMDHPNIVKVFSCGILELSNNKKYPFYIMEYLGSNVFPLEKALQQLPKEKHCPLILNALMCTASALQHSHNKTKYHKPTYHGDVKPSNILVINPDGESFQIKLIDFGFSRMLPKVKISDSRALSGRLANKMSSISRPTKARSELHADIWQLALIIDRLLQSYCSKEGNCLANCQGICPIDAPADFKALKELLTDWASTKAYSKAEIEPSTKTFHKALHELSKHAEISSLSSNFRGSLRYLSINEIGTVARIQPAYEAVRIPPRQFVVYPKRIKEIITAEPFGALRYTRQLGFAHLVYPGAQGTRFEHSLGVYDLACKFIQRLSGYAAFRRVCPNPKDAHLFVIAALLHDIGHFPLAHQLEEFCEIDFSDTQWKRLKGLLQGHLFHGAKLIDDLSSILMASGNTDADDNEGFGFSQDDITQLKLFLTIKTEIAKSKENCGLSRSFRFFRELLDSAIDLDKLDYVERDAYHCGVPYGNYLDTERILDNLRVIDLSSSLPIIAFHRRAIGCLEQLATARHQMYANVYWHRAVRSATVMFKHAFYIFNDLSNSSTVIENLFFSSRSDDVLLKSIYNQIQGMSLKRTSNIQRKIDLFALERLIKAVAGQRRDLYKTVIDRLGDDHARKFYGGSNYQQQRQKAKKMYNILKNSKFLEKDADKIGEHGILIDSRVDKQADFESVKIIDDNNTVQSLGYYVPSLSQLKRDFSIQACRIRVFIDPLILKPKFRSKEGRATVGGILKDKIESNVT